MLAVIFSLSSNTCYNIVSMSKHLLNFFLYVIIAGGSMATGQYAKCSNAPLGIEVINLEEDIAKKPPHEEPKPEKAIYGLC